MSISAQLGTPASHFLEAALELYCDLTTVLRARIATLKGGIEPDADAKGTCDLIRAHQKSLQSVLDIEASLDRRSRTCAEGASTELDLAAAQAEVAERLARWTAGT